MEKEVKEIRERDSVKLVKGQRGSYGWEVKVFGENIDEIMQKIEEADRRLLVKFGGEFGEKPD